MLRDEARRLSTLLAVKVVRAALLVLLRAAIALAAGRGSDDNGDSADTLLDEVVGSQRQLAGRVPS